MMPDYFNPWPVGSEWWRIVEEMNAKARRSAEIARAIDRLMGDPELTTAECPCCEGRGRVGIIIGAKDDV
jgi:hypothetical protein